MLEFGAHAVRAGDEIQRLRGAQRDGDTPGTYVGGILLVVAVGLDGNLQHQVIEVGILLAEVADSGCRSLLKTLCQVADLLGDARFAELVRFRVVGHGEQDIGAAGQFFGQSMFRIVVVERHADHLPGGQRGIDLAGSLVDKAVFGIPIVVCRERGLLVGIDVAVGHEPVFEVVDQEERDVADGVVVGVVGPGCGGDQGREVRRQDQTGRFAGRVGGHGTDLFSLLAPDEGRQEHRNEIAYGEFAVHDGC